MTAAGPAPDLPRPRPARPQDPPRPQDPQDLPYAPEPRRPPDRQEPRELPVRRTAPFDPPPELAALREESPLTRLRYPDGHLGWLVTGYATARAVLADPRFSARSEFKRVPVARPGTDPFYGAPALPGWLVDMDAPRHTRLRRRLAGAFTARRTRSLEPRITAIVDRHLTAMARRGAPADLVADFALPVPSLVICELLGVPYEDRADFQRHSATLFSLDTSADQAAAAMRELDAYLTDLVLRGRRSAAAEGLLADLAADADLTVGEIAGLGALLLSAGHETTAGSLSLGVFALLCHPAQLARLTSGAVPPDTVVEELLRYLTIFQFGVPRTPSEDVTLAGRTLRAGESVTVCLPAANRDPGRFPDPDRLDVGRRATGHLAFGHGVHQCIGQNLARAEMRIAFPALFARFPGLRPAVPPAEVPLGGDMGFYGVHRLPVTW
ncbi:cytochrome P450 [Streptomyces lavendulae]|uniref:cytochrome P450 n=1 Tax=Streptomyces lavendulae TaxID=1914 RepID=UPI0036BE11CE